MEFHENNKTFKKDSLDHFDKDVIKNVIYGYFSKNKCVTLRKLKVELFCFLSHLQQPIDEKWCGWCHTKSHPRRQA
jgi:hypothetical protein